MIEITIKTLDSRNHSFSVEDELTVKQLKERIAEPVNVPAESQRLIYCGRVLVDEKKLSEYDVNGKVIHLVQRAPPSSSTDNGGGSGNDFRTGSRRQFRSVLNQNVRVDGGGSGNAMYLGAMAFPADLMDAQGITMPQPRHGLSQSRLSVVRSMLRRGRYVLQNLENPNIQESPSEYNGNNIDHLALMAQAAAAAAIAASVTRNASGQTPQPPPPIISIEADTASGVPGDVVSVPEESASPPEEAIENASPNDVTADASAQPSAQAEEPHLNNRSGENGRNSRRYPGTTALAELISMVQDINRRLQPFLERYYVLMREDPVLENPAEEQRFFNQVSELMHFMSHAYHAISDVMCDFNQPPPRLLRCRPVLIQHSAVLQTGIPIQLNLNSNSQTRGTGTNTGESNENRASSEQERGGEQDVNSEERRSTSSEGNTASAADSEEIPPSQQPPRPTVQVTSDQGPPHLSGRSVSLGPSNFEFFMDVGQGSITIDSVEATVVTGSGNGESENPGANLPAGAASEPRDNRTSQSPPDFIQNFMQALAGHMSQALDATATVREERIITTSGSVSGSGNPLSSPTPQGHLNTSTQPTTSTQTRSTTRPHVHIAPALQGMGMPGFFDPFLPCNSHHIRSSRRRTQAQSEQTESQQHHHHHQPQPQPQPQTNVSNSQPQGNGASTNNVSVGANQEQTGIDSAAAAVAVAARAIRPSTPPFPVISAVASDVTSIFGNRPGTQETQRVEGGAARTIRLNPNDVTFLFQAHPFQHNFLLHYPNASGSVGPTTLEGLLQNSPDFNYTEGVSLVTDFFVFLARNVRLLDAISGEYRMIMFNMRLALAQFITTRLLSSRQESSNITEAVNRINTELRTILESMNSQEVIMREDVDFIATLSQLNHTTIPNLIRTVLEEDDNQYWRSIAIQLNQYARRLAAILLYCCHNGQDDFERLFLSFARRVIEGAPALQSWAASRLARQLRSMSSNIDSAECVHHLLVYRMGEGPTTAANLLAQQVPVTSPTVQSSGGLQPPPPPAPQSTASTPTIEPPIQLPAVTPTLPPQPVQQLQTQPMEVEEPPPPVPEQIAEPLPDVILGAEQWHNHVPPDWVPIITKDRERQRRQAVQGPLSDAYLSGMPSKRRKVVTSTKPQSNLAKVITESMSTAMGAAGVGTVDGLAETAGTDPSLRSAYKEQVRNTVQATLRSHPDYKPEKYPNAAKLFGPK